MSEQQQPQWLTGREVRQALRISQTTLHVLRRRGKLRAKRRGEAGHYLFCAASVNDYLRDPAPAVEVPPASKGEEALRGRAAKERLRAAISGVGRKKRKG